MKFLKSLVFLCLGFALIVEVAFASKVDLSKVTTITLSTCGEPCHVGRAGNIFSARKLLDPYFLFTAENSFGGVLVYPHLEGNLTKFSVAVSQSSPSSLHSFEHQLQITQSDGRVSVKTLLTGSIDPSSADVFLSIGIPKKVYDYLNLTVGRDFAQLRRTDACATLLAPKIQQMKERTPEWSWKPVLKELKTHVAKIVQPLAHGTFSREFRGILRDGSLRPKAVADAWDKSALSFSNLKEEDGWLASYGFAIRNQWQHLSFNAQSITGRDIADRYSDKNAFLRKPIIGGLIRRLLRSKIKKYVQQRSGSLEGFPVYLVLEGNDEVVDHWRPYPEKIPSEVRTTHDVSAGAIRVVLVPAAKIAEVNSMLLEAGMSDQVSVFPLELFEFEELAYRRSF